MINEKEKEVITHCARKYNVADVFLFGSSLDKDSEPNDIDIGVKESNLPVSKITPPSPGRMGCVGGWHRLPPNGIPLPFFIILRATASRHERLTLYFLPYFLPRFFQNFPL